MVGKFASRTWTRLLRIGGIDTQICLELSEDLENFIEFRARLGCVAHGSELVGALGQGKHKPWGLIGGRHRPEPLPGAAHLFYSSG